mgnify:CR=1 FL=1
MGKPEKFDDVMTPFRRFISDAELYTDWAGRAIDIQTDPDSSAAMTEYFMDEIGDAPAVVQQEWSLMLSRIAIETLPPCLGVQSPPRRTLDSLPTLKIWMRAKALEFASKQED